MGTISVDPAIVYAAAQRIDDAADLVMDAAALRLHFDGSVAGSSHAASGAAVRAAVEQVLADVRHWVAAARDTASALRLGADGHVAADTDAAAGLR